MFIEEPEPAQAITESGIVRTRACATLGQRPSRQQWDSCAVYASPVGDQQGADPRSKPYHYRLDY